MRLLLVLVSLLIVLATTIILAVSQGFFSSLFGKIKLDVHIPPSLNEQTLWGPKINHERLLLQLETKMLNREDGASAEPAGFMNERWLDLGSALFYSADDVQIHSETHALLLLYAAETGDRALFESVLKIIDKYFLLGDGLLREGLGQAALNPSSFLQNNPRPTFSLSLESALSSDETVWRAQSQLELHDLYASMIYMRSLALAYQNWGERAYSDALITAANAYLELCLDDLPPLHPYGLTITPTPPTFVNEEGGVSSTPTPTPTENKDSEIHLIRFSDIDLYTLYVLKQVNPAFDAIYENTLVLLQGAQREGLQVFAEAYDPITDTYVQYFREALVHLDEQLVIMMSLAEAEALNEGSIAWLKSRLNNYELVETYSLLDVYASGASSLPLRYGQLSRLARLLNDPILYQSALDRLLDGSISTVPQSPIYGLVFRTSTEENEAQITAIDNIWALLGTK